jgi:hypothetical protein
MSVRHIFQTYALSLDDDEATQNFTEYKVVLSAIEYAATRRIEPDFEYANTFPGEHYRILSGLVRAINPREIVDIGTYRGCSARVAVDNSPTTSTVYTFDLFDYLTFDWTVLNEIDFITGSLVQHCENLINPDVFEKHRQLLTDAELIILDGPKDSEFEPKFLKLLSLLKETNKPKWLFMDDIHFDNMLPLWRAIKSPKLDLTSFGHFSGSGLVDIQNGLKLKSN